MITIAQYSPQENAVGSIVIKPLSHSPQREYDVELREEFKQLIADIEFKQQRIVMSLPAEFAVVKKITLDADEEDARDAIIWEMSQHIIGSIEEYSVDFEPIKQSSADPVQHYLAVAYRSASVQKLTALLKINKLHPCIIDLDMFAMINVFEVNYGEKLSLPAILALGGEEKSIVIMTQGGLLIDYDVFAYDQTSMSPDEYAARLNEYCSRLCGAPGGAVPELYCAGAIFSHPEYMDSVAGKFKTAQLLDPFRKIICRAAKGESDMTSFAPQLSVAVGLALRGQTEL